MSQDTEDFISHYLRYIGNSESPMIYHRWCALAALGTMLARKVYLPFGHTVFYPNMYVMLIGDSAARKSTPIKIVKKITKLAGFTKFSGEKTSKEKFMLDLMGDDEVDSDILDKNLWGDSDSGDYREMWIACDEFNDFIGNGNLEFISLLGNLWDFEGSFDNRVKNTVSVSIPNPTINILGGNTPTNFARAFPSETLGQGFFSRLLLVYADPTGKRITFPVTPPEEDTFRIIEHITKIKNTCIGRAELTEDAKVILDAIYQSYKGIEDSRFSAYTGRRFTHLLKLCLIIAASHCSIQVSAQIVIEANTILTHTECLMPKALGEFGKSRNSDVTHKVLAVLSSAEKPMTLQDIWPHVRTDIEKVGDLAAHLINLSSAGKIQTVGHGFLAKRAQFLQLDNPYLNYDILTQQEKDMMV